MNNKDFINNNILRAFILDSMVKSRVVDEIEREYTVRGEAFFHASGAGHEGIAILQPHLTKEDYLHSHYRDKSLLIACGVDPSQYFLALFNKDASSSRGRQMNVHMSDVSRNIISLAGPVGNSALQAVGVAMSLKEKHDEQNKALVVCSQGEGTTSQGEFLEAVSVSVRDSLPILFIIEDNKFAISTPTEGKTFYQVGNEKVDSFINCPITRINGRYPHSAFGQVGNVVADVRQQCKPQIIVFSVDRLVSHSNADDERIYRTKEEIQELKDTTDPIINFIMSTYDKTKEQAKEYFEGLRNKIRPELVKKAAEAQREPEPKAIHTAKKPLPSIISEKADESFEAGDNTMIDTMREVLHEWLSRDKNVCLYGQDIEDPKGDVFGLTKGLSTKFPNRVVNSPLSESVIVGTSVGQALTGKRPVAFLQFSDFFPLAFNQIFCELGSMFWRSDGSWQSPVIVLATCGGYKPGLGPFHAGVMDSIAAHIPGVDVYAPSNAADAAGLLNAAFLSGRPTLFFYPKNQLNAKVRTISSQSARNHVIMPGTSRIEREGSDITLVGHGNTIPLCIKVAASLSQADRSAEIIDLRTLSPLDTDTVLKSVKKTKTLLVTHEDNRTASISSEVIARVSEAGVGDIKVARVVRSDTFVPCNFSNHLEVLPSYKKILETAVNLLDGTIRWENVSKEEEGFVIVEAVGTSPSDEQLTIIEWNVKKGDTITEGQLIGEAEADKAVSDIKAPVRGVVDEIYVKEGDSVQIGKPILRVKTDIEIVYTVTREETGIPHISFSAISQKTVTAGYTSDTDVYFSYVNAVLGNRIVDNKEIVSLSPEWTEDKILSSTGIAQRHWLGKDQTLVSIACEVAQKTLKEAGLKIQDMSGIICATGTHKYHAPSLAAMVQHGLLKQDIGSSTKYTGYAFDISSACSGFIFLLSEAYAKIKVNPEEKILLITAEELSSRVDMSDYGTAPVFSDAATACIMSTEKISTSGKLISPPILQTIGEPAKDLTVPENGYIFMNGVKVYRVAVEQITDIARHVCNSNNITFNDIDLIVPHQANVKIINSIARKLELPLDKFYINIDKHGNSSSSTIPICLHELIKENSLKGKKVLFVAFGGGYTFAGALVQY